MNPTEASDLILWLAGIGGLFALVLLLVLVLVLRISWRLARIEYLATRQQSQSEATEQPPSQAETSPGGAFEAFLEEDPGRRDLTKGEQFSSYRRWRQERGLNWSNS